MPWMEEPGGLQYMGSQSVKHATKHKQIKATAEDVLSALKTFSKVEYITGMKILNSYLNDSKYWKILLWDNNHASIYYLPIY